MVANQRMLPLGLRTQTSAARAIPDLLATSGRPVTMDHGCLGLWPGGAAMSKAARPKTVAPVSLAGS
jgi:hypothetical protein